MKIPAQVIVGKGRRGSKVQLSERFEQAIDRCAMKVLKSTEFKHHPENRDLVIDWAKCGVYEAKLIGDGSKPEMACGRCISVCPFSKLNQ